MSGSLLDTILHDSFFHYALIAGVFSGILCGIIGSFVISRKIAYAAGGISHASLGGIGLAIYLGISPLAGAFGGALVSAFLIYWLSHRLKQDSDIAISTLWSGGMSLGILFMALTPGYTPELNSYLFGNILLIEQSDIYMSGVLTLVIILLTKIFFRPLQISSFDEEFARIQGYRVGIINLLIHLVMALAIVILIRNVGLILVIALITLPTALAKLWVKSFKQLLIYSSINGIVVTSLGLTLSWHWSLPSGAIIVLTAIALYIMGLMTFKFIQKKA